MRATKGKRNVCIFSNLFLLVACLSFCPSFSWASALSTPSDFFLEGPLDDQAVTSSKPHYGVATFSVGIEHWSTGHEAYEGQGFRTSSASETARGRVVARMYDPADGRFISRDPLGYVDGASLYRGYFVPSMVDPLGLVLPPLPPSQTTSTAIEETFRTHFGFRSHHMSGWATKTISYRWKPIGEITVRNCNGVSDLTQWLEVTVSDSRTVTNSFSFSDTFTTEGSGEVFDAVNLKLSNAFTVAFGHTVSDSSATQTKTRIQVKAAPCHEKKVRSYVRVKVKSVSSSGSHTWQTTRFGSVNTGSFSGNATVEEEESGVVISEAVYERKCGIGGYRSSSDDDDSTGIIIDDDDVSSPLI